MAPPCGGGAGSADAAGAGPRRGCARRPCARRPCARRGADRGADQPSSARDERAAGRFGRCAGHPPTWRMRRRARQPSTRADGWAA